MNSFQRTSRDGYRNGEYGVNGDEKYYPDHVDRGEGASAGRPARRLEAPPLVAAMSQEHRAGLEARMRRKIDIRLMPTVVLMCVTSRTRCFVGTSLTCAGTS